MSYHDTLRTSALLPSMRALLARLSGRHTLNVCRACFRLGFGAEAGYGDVCSGSGTDYVQVVQAWVTNGPLPDTLRPL